MEKHQISTFISNLKIIKDCNVERIYFLKKHIINKIYLLAWQRDKLIKNIAVYNKVLIPNHDKFDLYETILLNINQNLSEPNFIFEKNKNKLFVTTKYLTKIPKYQKEYLLQNFKSSENIKILDLKNELYFEIISITNKNQNQDILFLKELEEKRKLIKELIDEAKFKRNKRD
ncbi:hypothetical protein [Spiroplasma floricola]|uniref:Uncharacterized protein n=1 Tax=Spiroplasma floricola 23-6 TaxID=1336749 RepID=A0A2K8SGU0_9MOLU|nr:hypothetical protein [Spiroplasma floricola]AUB32040.1 hypothetical protein SFLOR_v1c09920 [Spiroplasma floricola 23-6]